MCTTNCNFLEVCFYLSDLVNALKKQSVDAYWFYFYSFLLSKWKTCLFRSVLNSLHLLSSDNMRSHSLESQTIRELKACGPFHKVLSYTGVLKLFTLTSIPGVGIQEKTKLSFLRMQKDL